MPARRRLLVLLGLRSRAASNRALRDGARRCAEDAAGRAVADERARIAGELHDVVAHALSAMTVQATGARRLTLSRPELAREAFAAIEATGREALDELRRLLGVLRGEEPAVSLAPQPSLRHLPSLVRRTTASGLPVSLRVDGEARELAAGLDATASRVIQEALAAARDQGGAGRAGVRVSYGADTLDLEILDDGAGAAARPFAGVRERVRLHGGRFTAAPRPAGGYAVRATLAFDGRPVTAGGEAPDGDRRLTRFARDRAAPPRDGAAQRLAERRRIAREMHDVVAHSISVMVVQAGGARRILPRDAGRAVEAATRIERTGRDALGEMRHLLEMLSEGAPAALAPQPTLADIGELVTRARAAGLPAVLDVRGERRPLPAGLDLAAYRIVQEGLTNAMKHAPGAVTTVTVSWAPHDLALEIRNAAAHGDPEHEGHGLLGMAERVRLYGGELQAGPRDGGWRVSARLPLAEKDLVA